MDVNYLMRRLFVELLLTRDSDEDETVILYF